MEMSIKRSTPFDFHWSHIVIRYGVIFLIALINAHIRQGSFENYVFPLRPFLNVLTFGLVICSLSWVVTLLIKNRVFKTDEIGNREVSVFIGVNMIVAVVTYTLLYLILFGTQIHLETFAAYLFITIAVIIIENLIFILFTISRNDKSGGYRSSNLIIPAGSRNIIIEPKQIRLAVLEHGIIKLLTKNEGTLATQLQTLDELETKLPQEYFLRVNRQTILNKYEVNALERGVNRKLKIKLKEDLDDWVIPVSRYKKNEVLDWIKT